MKESEVTLLAAVTAQINKGGEGVILGPGDDAAVVDWEKIAPGKKLVLKTDATLSGVHVLPNTPLDQVGRKALYRAVSDLAAMGATPHYALITVAAPNSWSSVEWGLLAQGFHAAAEPYGITIVGGEMTRSQELYWISVNLIGSLGNRMITRSGAKPGDLIIVTGQLGGSFNSGRHLTFTPRLAEGIFLSQEPGVHAMMDLSDGLGSDLPRLAAASKVSFSLDKSRLPRHDDVSSEEAITDGEDYELLFTLDPTQWDLLTQKWNVHFPNLMLTPIGKCNFPDIASTELSQGFDCFT